MLPATVRHLVLFALGAVACLDRSAAAERIARTPLGFTAAIDVPTRSILTDFRIDIASTVPSASRSLQAWASS